MPKISVNISHKLNKSEAQSRVKNFVSNKLPNIGLGLSDVNVNWHDKGADFTFKVTAIGVKGNLKIDPNFINITSNIPLIFYPLKGKIEKIIMEHAAMILK